MKDQEQNYIIAFVEVDTVATDEKQKNTGKRKNGWPVYKAVDENGNDYTADINNQVRLHWAYTYNSVIKLFFDENDNLVRCRNHRKKFIKELQQPTMAELEEQAIREANTEVEIDNDEVLEQDEIGLAETFENEIKQVESV